MSRQETTSSGDRIKEGAALIVKVLTILRDQPLQKVIDVMRSISTVGLTQQHQVDITSVELCRKLVEAAAQILSPEDTLQLGKDEASLRGACIVAAELLQKLEVVAQARIEQASASNSIFTKGPKGIQ